MLSRSSETLVSVVIPCYQQERYLKASIESALGQSYPNVEVIVVNDGSTDGSAMIAAGYGSRIQFIEQPNSGVTATRNRGAAAARGKYLLFLDADDVLDGRAVELHLEAMQDRDDRLTVLAHKEFVDHPALEERQPENNFTVVSSLPRMLDGSYCAGCWFIMSAGSICTCWQNKFVSCTPAAVRAARIGLGDFFTLSSDPRISFRVAYAP